jgi:hypothetical protein
MDLLWFEIQETGSRRKPSVHLVAMANDVAPIRKTYDFNLPGKPTATQQDRVEIVKAL